MSSTSEIDNFGENNQEFSVLAKLSLYLYTFTRRSFHDDNEIDIILKHLDYSMFKDQKMLSFTFLKMIKFNNDHILIKLIKILLKKKIEIDRQTILEVFIRMIRKHGKDCYYSHELLKTLTQKELVSKIRGDIDSIDRIAKRYINKDSYREYYIHKIQEILHDALND